MELKFAKYHGLGNDYLVLEPRHWPNPLPDALIRQVCDRHYGAGSDGILWGPLDAAGIADFGLRIFNPDGSEAQKSGNGLRIFGRYLYETGQVGEQPFSVHTPGGVVRMQVFPGGSPVQVQMGRLSFASQDIPLSGSPRLALEETIWVDGQELRVYPASLGNPHCVILMPEISAEIARRLGPGVECHPLFPQRVNVQFLKVLNDSQIQIEIWERGAGYTLASGSSACAAGGVAYRMGWCGNQITAHMPGGSLELTYSPDLDVTLTGPVAPVYRGVWKAA